MDDVVMPKISAESKFSDIIVPTQDLVRGSFLIHLMTTNKKKVGEMCKSRVLAKIKRFQ